MILFYILLEDKDRCTSLADCNKLGNTGEVCDVDEKCKCGAALCGKEQICVSSVCSMYLKSNNPNKIINTKLI
jgi:hypothetical protein